MFPEWFWWGLVVALLVLLATSERDEFPLYAGAVFVGIIALIFLWLVMCPC